MTVHDPSQLLAETPARLTDRSIPEYGALLRHEGALGPEHLERVDYALRHAVVRLLKHAREDELQSAYGHLRALVPVKREKELDSWRVRWRGFADLLDARLAILAGRNPEKAGQVAHVPEILQALSRRDDMTQVELGEAVGLKPANLSRILSILEGHDLIYRRKVGREKRIFLQQADDGQPAEAPQPRPMPRLATFLTTNSHAALAS